MLGLLERSFNLASLLTQTGNLAEAEVRSCVRPGLWSRGRWNSARWALRAALHRVRCMLPVACRLQQTHATLHVVRYCDHHVARCVVYI